VHVFAHSSAAPPILEEADQTTGTGLFNGNDALVLLKNGVVVDSIGEVGHDPDAEWGSGDTSTADNTLRRKADVVAGDTDPSDTFDPAAESAGT
jgi:predicted extracellular nuclease